MGDSVGASGYGQHDANWLAFYDFFREACGLEKETEILHGLWSQAKSAGWYLPHQNICWVSERHNICRLDDQNRIHSLSGPAVAFPDGWSIYAVHGVRVPSQIIEHPGTITIAQIESETNTEIRRVMLDSYGIDRYLLDAGVTPIHSDNFGALFRKELPDDEPLVIVKVRNATPEPDGSVKDYFLRVPPSITTAHDAIAWTFGLDKKQYTPLAES